MRYRAFWRRMNLAMLFFLTLFAGARAVAESGAIDRIQPRVDRGIYEALLESLDIDEDQHAVGTILYGDYAVALQSLAERLDSEERAAGRDRLEDHLTGRAPLDSGALQRIQSGIRAARESAKVQAHRLIRELIGNTRLLVDVTDADFESALRPLHREVYLQPLRANEHDETYAGEGVDLVQLATEASAAGGELDRVDPASLQHVLDAYAVQLDDLLVSIAAADSGSEAPGGAGMQQATLDRWRVLHELNHFTAQEIGRLAAAAGGQTARQRWLERVETACFPWLFTSTLPQRQHEWIVRRGLEAEKLQKAEAILAEYQAKHRQLCRELIDLHLQARLSHGVILHSRLSPAELNNRGVQRLYESMMRNSGRRAGLDRESSDALQGLLSDAQRKQMIADLAAAAYGRRR